MRIQTAAHLGALIRDRRIQRGLGQQTLANLVGVGRQWISEIEKGKPRAEIGLILKTLGALGIELTVTDKASSPMTDFPARGLPDAIVEAARHRRPSLTKAKK